MMKLLDYFTNASKWAKKWYYYNDRGDKCQKLDAVSCCLRGALMKIYTDYDEREKCEDTLESVVIELYPDRKSEETSSPVVAFNDHPATTFDDVLKVLEKANV